MKNKKLKYIQCITCGDITNLQIKPEGHQCLAYNRTDDRQTIEALYNGLFALVSIRKLEVDVEQNLRDLMYIAKIGFKNWKLRSLRIENVEVK